MKTLRILLKRNVKLFFRDKGFFLTSLITPMILLVLYATFLGNVYRDSFLMGIPPTMDVTERLVDGIVAGQLFSSLLAVSCVTVAFCSNMLMVQDKLTGMTQDMLITPVKRSVSAMAYFIACFGVTYFICLVAAVGGFAYIASQGWYLSALDVVSVLLDMALLVTFGTALSSCVNFFSFRKKCHAWCGLYLPCSGPEAGSLL